MDISSDYKDLFRILNKHKVKYLIVGAYAVVYYTEPRFTKDIDVWVNPDIKNAHRLHAALKEFGAPLKGIRSKDFTNKHLVYQIGVAPIRIDIMMGLSGLRFDAAWKNRSRSLYGNIPIAILGIKELVKTKRKSKRAQDRFDADKLLPKLNKRSRKR